MAVSEVHLNPTREGKRKIAQLFKALITDVLRMSKKEFHQLISDKTSLGRVTVDRWFNGTSVPNLNNVRQLRQVLVPPPSFAAQLLNPRYRSVLEILNENAYSIDQNQLSDLIDMAEKSKGIVSLEMCRIFLGLGRVLEGIKGK